jgi:hypothetical protein
VNSTRSSRRYTETEASRTGVIVKQGHQLIEALFGRDLPSISQ